MKDEIDLFFDQHRNTFRSEDPPEGHEHRFRLKLEGQSSKGKQRFMTWLPLAWAASLILAVLAGAFFFSNQDSSGAKDYVKTRKHFESLVEQQESILVSMNQEVTGHWYADVENQLDKLQSNQKQLQDDYRQTGKDPRVLQAMIQNYRTQIELLKEIQHKIQTHEKQKSNNHREI